MCGRFTMTSPWELLRERFEVDIAEEEYRLRYNAAPGQDLWVIPAETPSQAQLFHWGLVPFRAKDPKIGNRLINARAETVAEKPAFRTPFRKHRCLVLADGFYEWDKKGAKRVPYRVVDKCHNIVDTMKCQDIVDSSWCHDTVQYVLSQLIIKVLYL